MNLRNETIESLSDYIPRLLSAQQSLITYCREENSLAAYEMLPSYAEGLEWVLQAAALIDGIEPIFSMDFTIVNSYLVQINDGILREDLVLIADILEYELNPVMETILARVKE